MGYYLDSNGNAHGFLATPSRDLVAKKLALNTDGSLDFTYEIDGHSLAQPADVALFWSPTVVYDPNTAQQLFFSSPGDPFTDDTQTETSLGTHVLHLQGSDFSIPHTNGYLLMETRSSGCHF